MPVQRRMPLSALELHDSHSEQRGRRMRRSRLPDQAIQGCMQPQTRHMQGTSVVLMHRPATPSSRRHARHGRQPCSASGLYLAQRQVSADPAIAPWLSRSIGDQDQPEPGIQCCPWRAISGLRAADSSTKRDGPPDAPHALHRTHRPTCRKVAADQRCPPRSRFKVCMARGRQAAHRRRACGVHLPDARDVDRLCALPARSSSTAGGAAALCIPGPLGAAARCCGASLCPLRGA